MFVACQYSHQFRHIKNEQINGLVFKMAFYEYIIHRSSYLKSSVTALCNNICRAQHFTPQPL